MIQGVFDLKLHAYILNESGKKIAGTYVRQYTEILLLLIRLQLISPLKILGTCILLDMGLEIVSGRERAVFLSCRCPWPSWLVQQQDEEEAAKRVHLASHGSVGK